jgi:hypothetical protein
MRVLAGSAAVLLLMISGCGPHYTIPNFETDEIERVVSSGRTPEACFENLKEDAQRLNVKVRVTDVSHESPGPVSWIWMPSYTCTGRVVKSRS